MVKKVKHHSKSVKHPKVPKVKAMKRKAPPVVTKRVKVPSKGASQRVVINITPGKH